MRYHGLLYAAMVALLLLIFVKNGSLFYDPFFGLMYVVIGLILVMGTRFREDYKIDVTMGCLILLTVTIFTIYILFSLAKEGLSPAVVFQMILLIFLDLCGIAFLNEAKHIKEEKKKPEKEFKGWRPI